MKTENTEYKLSAWYENTLWAVVCLVFFGLILLNQIRKHPDSWLVWTVLITFVLVMLWVIKHMWSQRFDFSKSLHYLMYLPVSFERQSERSLHADTIVFTDGYYFKPSSVYKTNKIHATQINRIFADGGFFQVVINHNEIIFIPYSRYTDAMTEFAKKNGIAFENIVAENAKRYHDYDEYDDDIDYLEASDQWTQLFSPFEKKHLCDVTKREFLSGLEAHGFDENTIAKVEAVILPVVSYRSLYDEVWVGFSHFSCLHTKNRRLTKARYWLSMELSLGKPAL